MDYAMNKGNQAMAVEHTMNTFILSHTLGTEEVREELAQVMTTVDALLQLTVEELHVNMNCSRRLWYTRVWLSELDMIQQLYAHLYGDQPYSSKCSKVFTLNPQADDVLLHHALTAHIHQLHSLCHLAAYEIFHDRIDSHLLNAVITINNHMRRMVDLIDWLDLYSLSREA